MAEGGNKVDAFSLDAGVPKIEGDIRPQPKYADRISKRVIGVALAIIVLMISIFFAALDAMDRKKQGHQEAVEAEKKKSQSNKFAETVAPKDLTDAQDAEGPKGRTVQASLVGPASNAQDDLLGGGGAAPSLTNGGMPRLPSQAAGQGGSVPAMGPAQGRGPGQVQVRGEAYPGNDGLATDPTTGGAVPTTPPPLTPEQQAEQAAKQDRLKRLAQARSNGLSSKSYGGEEKKSAPAASSAAAATLLAGLQGQAGGMLPAALQGLSGQKTDSEQDEKLSFIKNAGKDDRSYLPHTQQTAVSRNELKRGSYLPLRLEGAINSGQPGMVRARVTEDVYDTVTGCRLLVPAMTIVQGAYDSKVAVGQTRNLVVWNYMGFEDGSDLNLGAMQGYDSTGAAGIEADVDNHYIRLFGLTFGMSMITAAVQQSVPTTPTGTTAQTPQQSIANALTQQYGQLGAQILGKYMQVQPTLRNYAGERFMIMLPLTIVFKKVWRNRCGGGV